MLHFPKKCHVLIFRLTFQQTVRKLIENLITRVRGKVNKNSTALVGVAQLVGALSYNPKVVGSTPNQGTCLGCRFGPRSGCM